MQNQKPLVTRPKNAFADEISRKRGIILITMVLGFIGATLHATFLPRFEIVAFLTFLGPLGLGAYGFRTYRATKENEENAETERTCKVDPLIG